MVYLEGYLWEQPSAKAAIREAIELAHVHDAAVALSVSDPFCVEHHRRSSSSCSRATSRCCSPTRTRSSRCSAFLLRRRRRAVAETGVLAVLTRGAAGCVVVTASGPVEVPAAPVDRVVDTTGAGDLFAAGFLYGITNGLSPEESARLGGVCAAEVISHVGARPLADLRALAGAPGSSPDLRRAGPRFRQVPRSPGPSVARLPGSPGPRSLGHGRVQGVCARNSASFSDGFR